MSAFYSQNVTQNSQNIAATPGLFLLNPSSNRKFVAGESSRIGNVRFGYIVVAILLIIAVGVGYLGINDLIRTNHAEQSGTATEAIVTDGYSSTSNRGGTSYYIDYEFKIDGQVYKKHVGIGSDLYNRLLIGDPVHIKYLPSDPSVSVLSGTDKDDTDRNSSIAMLAIVLPTCLIISGLILLNDRKNRKLSRGQLLPGTITAVRGRNGSRGSYLVSIDYRFTNPFGQEITKSQTGNRPDLRRAGLPAAGTPITVLYVDDKLQRLM